MNKPLRAVAIFCGLLMLGLLIRANWVQYVRAPELAADQENRRVQIEQFAAPRGDIVVGGQAITGSTEVRGTDLKYKRTYVNGPMYAPVTGYASQSQGMTLLEKTYDGILTGKDDRLAFQRFADAVSGKGHRPGSVVTTIDPKAQKAAYDGLTELKGARGAVVALDPETGKVLALVSAPSYDASRFAGSTFKESDRFVALDKDKRKPLANRALREIYPPVPRSRSSRQRPPWSTGSSPTSMPVRMRSPPIRCRSRATRSAARLVTLSATRRR